MLTIADQTSWIWDSASHLLLHKACMDTGQDSQFVISEIRREPLSLSFEGRTRHEMTCLSDACVCVNKLGLLTATNNCHWSSRVLVTPAAI